jgi:hypothetical protein
MRQRRSSKYRSIGICAALAVGTSLGVLAPPALAAPANDNFANRAVMPSTLPSEVEGSNVGATAESPEWISGLPFDGHHSVWWEWLAPETRLVAVGTCGTEFRSRVGIFTGEALSELLGNRVVPSSAPEPGGCGERYLFEAVAGTKYELGVDGDGFYIPGPEGEPVSPPEDEGAIRLQITPQPAPANDDIAGAAPFNEIMWELPADGRRQVLGNVQGYNWGATTQPGEPAGHGAGASVWYRWTPVESGQATFTVMTDHGRPDLDIYARGPFGALTPVASGTGEYPTAGFLAEGEREYLVRVDGAIEESGLPWMGTFSIVMSQNLPPSLGPPPTEQVHSAPHKLDAPPTTLTPPLTSSPPAAPVIHAPTVGAAGTATVRFGDSTRGVSFRCKVDADGFHRCASPLELRGLAPGRHRLEVRAKAHDGVGSRSAVLHFRVPAPHRDRHAAG